MKQITDMLHAHAMNGIKNHPSNPFTITSTKVITSPMIHPTGVFPIATPITSPMFNSLPTSTPAPTNEKPSRNFLVNAGRNLFSRG